MTMTDTPRHPGQTGVTAPLSRATPRLTLTLIWLGAAAAVGLWWHDTSSIQGLADWLTNAGRITGMLAGYAVVVLVALMARIPMLERGVGSDQLARWHAMGGRYAVSLVVAHGLLITWGYAVAAHTSVVSQASTLFWSYPNMMAATAGGLLLVAVGVVSARAARRRMRYETWYYLHFATYLAVALAFSHQLSTGAEFMTHPATRLLWQSMYAGVAGLLVWHRIITPIRQAARHRLRVLAVIDEGPGTISVVIAGRHLDELRVESGQFFRWRFLTRDLWWAANPYSLSAPVQSNRMRITIKGLGDHSQNLRHLQPGTRVFAEGPYGAFTGRRRRQRKVLLIAGGVGITPVRALFQSLPAGHGDLTLLYRVSQPEDVIFRDELQAIATARGARLHIVSGRRTDLPGDPLSAATLMTNVPHLRSHDVYVCGPEGMTTSTVSALRRAGVPSRQIHHESFTL